MTKYDEAREALEREVSYFDPSDAASPAATDILAFADQLAYQAHVEVPHLVSDAPTGTACGDSEGAHCELARRNWPKLCKPQPEVVE